MPQDKHNLITLNWLNMYSCVGGECTMTCCNAHVWTISLTEEEIKMYNSLSGGISDKIRSSIDYDKQCIKSKKAAQGIEGEIGHQCSLLTDNGWCKIILNHGDDYLSHTCKYYPRNIFSYNGCVFQFVDITCPVVSEFLLDDSQYEILKFNSDNLSVSTQNVDAELFNNKLLLMDFLTGLLMNVDGFLPGKCFILFDIVNGIQSIIDTGDLSEDSFNNLLSKYELDDNIISILEEAESFNENLKLKAEMAKIAMRLTKPIITQIPEITGRRTPDLIKHMDEWLDTESLEKDLKSFYEYRDRHFHKFIEKFLAYRVFSLFLKDTDRFALGVKAGYLTILLDEIVAMSAWKSNGGEITKEDYSYIISSLERRIFHSGINQKMMEDSIDSIEHNLNFDIFMMPVY